VFSPALGAVLGGVLLPLGARFESGMRTRYWVERGPRPRLFVAGR
jgi:hypothetical protein